MGIDRRFPPHQRAAWHVQLMCQATAFRLHSIALYDESWRKAIVTGNEYRATILNLLNRSSKKKSEQLRSLKALEGVWTFSAEKCSLSV